MSDEQDKSTENKILDKLAEEAQTSGYYDEDLDNDIDEYEGIDYTFQDEFEELAMQKLEILEKLNAANANGGARHKLNNELRAVNEKLDEF